MMKSSQVFVVVLVVSMTTGCGVTPVGPNMEVNFSSSSTGSGLPGKLVAGATKGLHNAARKHVCGDAPLDEERSARRHVETDNYYNTAGSRHKKRLVPATKERVSVQSSIRC